MHVFIFIRPQPCMHIGSLRNEWSWMGFKWTSRNCGAMGSPQFQPIMQKRCYEHDRACRSMLVRLWSSGRVSNPELTFHSLCSVFAQGLFGPASCQPSCPDVARGFGTSPIHDPRLGDTRGGGESGAAKAEPKQAALQEEAAARLDGEDGASTRACSRNGGDPRRRAE